MYLQPGAEPPLKGKGSKLGPKMRLFVSEYLIDLNAAAAVRRAGYKSKNPSRLGSELLAHPLVRRELDEFIEKKQERNILTADYVINKLIDIVENTESGNPQAALRGLELLGKSLALFKERQEITGADGNAIEYEQRIKKDVDDFTRSLARLADRGGEGEVVEFPVPGKQSGA